MYARSVSQAFGGRVDIPGRIVQRKVETHLLGVRGYHCGCLLPGSPSKGSSDSIPRLSCASSFPAWCRCSSCIQMDVCSQPPEGQVVERGLLEMLLLLLPSHFSCVQLCATPLTAAHEAHLSLGFSRQEHWSGLPFPSPMHKSESEVAQLYLTLRDPMDCSLPGSSVHGIFQVRVLEWGAFAFRLEMLIRTNSFWGEIHKDQAE